MVYLYFYIFRSYFSSFPFIVGKMNHLLTLSQMINTHLPHDFDVIETAWAEQGLRYDPVLKVLARKPSDHAMTLRSHCLSLPEITPLFFTDIRDLFAALRDQRTTICFIKKNGSMRRMCCTLAPMVANRPVFITQIDGLYHARCGEDILMKNNLLTLWDVDQQAWRSVYIDTIITVDQCFFLVDANADRN